MLVQSSISLLCLIRVLLEHKTELGSLACLQLCILITIEVMSEACNLAQISSRPYPLVLMAASKLLCRAVAVLLIKLVRSHSKIGSSSGS